MNTFSHKGFTLIEMIVAMMMFFIVVSAAYIPYSYYQKKANLRNEAKQVAQLLYEARNMAINGQSNDSENVSIGIYFDGENHNSEVTLFSYPYTFSGSQIIPEVTPEIEVMKKLYLKSGIQVDTIGGEKNALFFYNAISGEGKYYFFDSGGNRQEFPVGYIDIQISFKGATTENLQKILSYYTPTHIIDY